jgi:hypothetical protein
MSTINTNGIDVNYPVPGINNSSQGFRDNFASIKTNLNTASAEITDLQNKAVLKAALDNSTLDNDMAGTLISNATTRTFRASTYNLGNALSGTVLVDVSLGDVQYGNVAGNVTLQFGGWAPINTESSVVLKLGISNSEAIISFPAEVVSSNSNFGVTLLENFDPIANVATVTAPHGVTQLNYQLKTIDCGNTISITPLNRPFQSTQIQTRTPPLTGQIGDVTGTVCIDSSSAPQLTVTSSTSTDFLVTANTITLFTGMPVTFTGNSFESNIVAGATYYVSNIANATHFKISPNADITGNLNLLGSSGNLLLNPVSYMYVAVDDYNANAYPKLISNTTAPNIITLSSSTANIDVNFPIIFTGNGTSNANVEANVVYYIKSVTGSNITISKTIDNGIAGPTFENVLTFTPGTPPAFNMVVYDGEDIFRKIPLMPGTLVPTSADIPSVSDIRIGGGVNGYVLTTDGTGNLAWAAGAGSGNGVVAGSNTQVQYNNAGSFGATAGFTFDNVTNLLSAPGNITAVDTITGANVTVSNLATIANLNVTANANVVNLSASGQVVATSNVVGGNLVTNGLLTVTGNATVGNLITVGSVNATGTVSGGILSGGSATITGNGNVGNLYSSGLANATGNIFSNANVIANVYFVSSVANLVVAAGTTQATGTQLGNAINLITTVPASTGVVLPAAIIGLRIVVRNAGANALNVYPATGAQINALGVNAAYSLATNTSIEFFCTTGGGSGQWYTL